MDEAGFSLSEAGGYKILAKNGIRSVKVLAPSDK